ncbi:MAG: P-loop NTPase [Thermoplasmatales archaeon]|nr:P-loop NTPase [Thermoplasmatales archaeon]
MEARVSVIEKRLKNIKRIISVASGKGGVGKSLVASSLALNLANKGYNVGLFDLDLYGPSSHVILGVKGQGFPEEEKGIIPPKVHGIGFMSVVYFTEDKPSPFRGIDVSNIIIELLAITQWGSLDYLVIDMPPGIGDETLDVIRLIKKSEFLVVSTPSKVALAAVSKLLKLLKELKIPIIGVLENMAMTKSSFIQNEVGKLGLPYLGSISFDKNLEESIGKPDRLLDADFMKDLDKILEGINL